MARYEKCPRCDLNYIDVERQEYCDICLAEMKGEHTAFVDLADEEDEMELCPRCGENMMKVGEKMCDECKKKIDFEEEEEIDIEKDEGWRDFVEDEPEDILPDAPDALDDFEDDEEEEDELYHGEDEEEDLDYVTAEEAADMALDDEDDEDEEDDF